MTKFRRYTKSTFSIEITQFIDGDWQYLATVDVADEVVDRFVALETLSQLTEKLHNSKSLFFVKSDGIGLVINQIHGPVILKLIQNPCLPQTHGRRGH